MGNHGHSDEGNRLMCEWIWDGAIGPVRQVHSWSTSGSRIPHTGLPSGTYPVPETLDWKLWLGPRKYRPYHPEYTPFDWRCWWDFGTGVIGDLAIHHFDPAYTAMKVSHPTWIKGQGQWIDDQVAPPNNRVEWCFEETDTHPELRFIWYDGDHAPPRRPDELEEGRNMGDNGILVVGDHGKILGGGWSGTPRLIPEHKMKAYQRPPKILRRSPGHHREWLDAIKGGPEPASNFEFGAMITEFVLLGNIATRTGEKIYWNADTMKIKGRENLDPFIRGQYPDEWSLTNI
jgi:hypothetical protein